MTVRIAPVPLLVFEAAGCLMAVPASEVTQLSEKGSGGRVLDLDEYFTQQPSAGPWLQWKRGALSAWLRVRRVVDVVAVPLPRLRPIPKILREQHATRAFLAAGISGDDVFLLLDPARLD